MAIKHHFWSSITTTRISSREKEKFHDKKRAGPRIEEEIAVLEVLMWHVSGPVVLCAMLSVFVTDSGARVMITPNANKTRLLIT